MKIRDILNKDTATISFEVFPPKKSTDFGNVEAAALGIAALQPAYMSVTYGAGGSTKGHTIALAGEIEKQHNVPTVVHLTCVCADRGASVRSYRNAGSRDREYFSLRGDIPKDFDREKYLRISRMPPILCVLLEKRRILRGWRLLPRRSFRFC